MTTKKTPKTKNIQDYYITDGVYKDKPLVNFNLWYRDWGFNPTSSSVDSDVWTLFAKFPVNPCDKKENIKIDTSKLSTEEILNQAKLRRSALVDELSEMWLWNDEDKREKFSFYETLPIVPEVPVPMWIFSLDNTYDDKLNSLSNVEKVALCYIMEFTKSHTTGYIECSGNIEKACMCTVNEAHDAIISLWIKGFLLDPEFPPHDTIYNLYRCASWKVNPMFLKVHLENQGIRWR